MIKNKLITVLISLLALSPLVSENVNGQFKGSLSLSNETILQMALEELISIKFDKENEFLEGIELKIKVPEELQKYRNSFALYMYKEIQPQLNINNRFYRGNRIVMRLLPVQNYIYLKIPTKEENSIVQSADSILIPGFIAKEDYPLLVTILPIMKGIPSTVFNHKFELMTKGLYSPKGSLKIDLNSNLVENEEYYLVLIDDEKVKWPSLDGYILNEGLHEISVSSSTGMTKNASIVINSGEKHKIEFSFQYSEPQIQIEAPEGTIIYLDDEELLIKNPGESISLNAGEHIVIFDIGGYQFSREFIVEPGENLTISLVLDVLIHKN